MSKSSHIDVSNCTPASRRESAAPDEPEHLICTSRLEDWDSLANIEQAWADLVNRNPSSSVFQTFQWHSCWWKAFGDRHRLFVILCHKDKQLVGIAPMMITRNVGAQSHPRAQICFIGSTNGSSDYLDFIVDPNTPEALDAILNEIFEYLSEVGRIHLSHFPTHFENQPRTVAYFEAHATKVVVEFDQEAPCLLMGNRQEDLRVANKSSLRRRYNYFKKSGDLRFHQCSSESEILAYIDTFFDQHMARRDLTDSPSQFRDPAQRSFYRDLVYKLFPQGWLRFDTVLFDGQPIAFHFGFEYRNKFIWYKPTFDVQYWKRSPGEVLIKFLLEDAIEKGLDEFDFTVGSEAFKHRFSNEVRYNSRLIAFRSFVDYWLYRLKITLKRMLGRAPPIDIRIGAASAKEP
jgi:CelD/BcsL family acetyltransferase involved in cellulose biosynthesis